MKDLNSVSKHFQNEYLTIVDVPAVLNEFIKKPSSCSILGTYVDIVLYPSFQSAITKIQDVNELETIPDENWSVTQWLQPNLHSQFDVFDNLPLLIQ